MFQAFLDEGDDSKKFFGDLVLGIFEDISAMEWISPFFRTLMGVTVLCLLAVSYFCIVLVVCDLFDYIDTLESLNRFFKALLKCLVLGLSILSYCEIIELVVEAVVLFAVFCYQILC